jgi:hypothetical protein
VTEIEILIKLLDYSIAAFAIYMFVSILRNDLKEISMSLEKLANEVRELKELIKWAVYGGGGKDEKRRG